MDERIDIFSQPGSGKEKFMKTKQRVELHLHTNISKIHSGSNIKEYVDMAARSGMVAMAVTDNGVAHAFPLAYKATQEFGIKLIYGMEGYLVDNVTDSTIYHVSILVKNKEGLKNLYRLITKSHIDYFFDKPLIPRNELVKHREGLILGSACEHGELFRAILDEKNSDELLKIADFYDYLEVQPIENHQFLVESGIVKDKNMLTDINRIILRLGEETNKPVVATGGGECSYSLESVLQLKTTDEMIKEFSYLGSEKAYEIVVENSNRIADLTEDGLAPFPNVFYYPTVENADEDLKVAAYAGLKKVYGQNPPKIAADRLKRELEIIIEYGNSYLFLIAKKMVDEAGKNGCLVGSRGDVSASFVAFLIGITDINPLEAHYVCPNCCYTEFQPQELCGWNMRDKYCPVCTSKLNKDGFLIPMEALFGVDGNKVPDINLCFSVENREASVNYLKQMFGTENVVACGKVIFTSEKGAVCHPSAVFILPKNLDILDITPLQYSNNDSMAEIITHFDYNDLLLQNFDIFGYDDYKILKMLYDATGYNPKHIPLDDAKTINLISGDDSRYFGFNLCKKLLNKFKPTSFEELMRIYGGLLSGLLFENCENREKLLEQDNTLNEVISCREDVVSYLTQKGICKKNAYKIMDFVRRGKPLTQGQKNIMKINNIPEWYIEECSNIKCLLSRADCAAKTLTAFRIAYYRAHFETEYDNVIKELRR